MAETRIRTVKPALARHRPLFDLEKKHGIPLRFIWAMLPTSCCREGRFNWRPWDLKLDIVPYDQDLDFEFVLDVLWQEGYVVKYQVGAETYGLIPTFGKHQSINNRESPSTRPGPSDGRILTPPSQVPSSTRGARVGHASSTCHEGKGREGKGKEGKGGEDACATDAGPGEPGKPQEPPPPPPEDPPEAMPAAATGARPSDPADPAEAEEAGAARAWGALLDLEEALECYREQYALARGAEPLVQEEDHSALGRLIGLRGMTMPRLKALIAVYVRMDEAWFKRHGWRLSVLETDVQKVDARLQEQSKAMAAKSPPGHTPLTEKHRREEQAAREKDSAAVNAAAREALAAMLKRPPSASGAAR